MLFRMMLLCAAVVLVVSGCNLQAAAPPTEVLPTDSASDAPQVTILSPTSGTSVQVDQQVNVEISAEDAVGVTRAQLFSNGQIVRTITSDNPDGVPQFTGTLDYTPRRVGEYTLSVIVYRGVVPSNTAEIIINVTEPGVSVTERPTATPGGGNGGSGPTIPNDGVCRALVNAPGGLRMRAQPTTTVDNIITVLPDQTLAPVVGRLGNNSWWKLSYGGQLGWVSAQFTTLYGNCLNVPVEVVVVNTPTPQPTFPPAITVTPRPTNTPLPAPTATPGQPDLIVTRISGSTSLTLLGDATEVTEEYAATVSNFGAGSTGQFEVRLLMGNQQYDLGVVSNLNPNESIILTRTLTFTSPGTYNIRVDVDPNNAVQEISEVNNRGDITVTVVQN